MISAATRLVALLGHPVAHSLSPRMQNAAFAARALDWAYTACDVDPGAYEWVVDLVYGERDTALIAAARAAGATVVDGLEILVRQGALSFVRNDGIPPPPPCTCRTIWSYVGASWSRFGPVVPCEWAAASVWHPAQPALAKIARPSVAPAEPARCWAPLPPQPARAARRRSARPARRMLRRYARRPRA